MLDNLKKYEIILASKSPRRKELLEGLDLDFCIRFSPDVDESYPQDTPTPDIPLFIAKEKADAYKSLMHDRELVITADTVVIVGDKVLGKPKDDGEAHNMLRTLSGRTHQVVTGVCLTTKEKQKCFSVSTDVTFRELTDPEIDYYVKTYQPTDKAGAYGIQEWIGYVGVTAIKGSYFNVMGLPVQRIYNELISF